MPLPTRLRFLPLEDRLTPAAGALDPSFGTDGVALVDPIAAGSPPGGRPVNAAALQPDGRIVLAGTNASNGHFAVVRLTPDGALDSRFGSGGEAEIAFDNAPGANVAANLANGVAVQPDGKLVVVGR